MNTLKKWLSTISYKIKLIKCIIFDEPISVKKRDTSIDEIVSRIEKDILDETKIIVENYDDTSLAGIYVYTEIYTLQHYFFLI